MAAAVGVVTRVVIIDGSLYRPRGLVWNWVHKVGTLLGANTRAGVHSRTGKLKRSIRVSYRKPGTKRIQATIGSNMPYVGFVIRGTTGPIMSDALWALPGHEKNPAAWTVNAAGKRVPAPGMTMAVGRNPYPPVTPKFRVSGQRANNFFYDGWMKTRVKHPAIGKAPFPVGLT